MNIDIIVNNITPINPKLKIISKVGPFGIGILLFSDILTIAATNTAGINNTIIITILHFSTPFLNTTGITIENNIAKMHGTTIEVAMISFIFISDCKI